jgi:hypothetical protein
MKFKKKRYSRKIQEVKIAVKKVKMIKKKVFQQVNLYYQLNPQK